MSSTTIMSLKDAAEAMNMGVETLRKRCKDGRFPSKQDVQKSGRVRLIIEKADVEEFTGVHGNDWTSKIAVTSVQDSNVKVLKRMDDMTTALYNAIGEIRKTNATQNLSMLVHSVRNLDSYIINLQKKTDKNTAALEVLQDKVDNLVGMLKDETRIPKVQKIANPNTIPKASPAPDPYDKFGGR